jgi:catecholate siderophore receptor
MAVGTLAAYTVLGGRVEARGPAPAGVGAAPGPDVGQSQQPVRRFEIPPGPLDAVLGAFRVVTGREVSTALPASLLQGVPSPGVSGDYTEEQALERLLAGTGIGYQVEASNVVTLGLRTHSESVDVTGAVSKPSSPRYTEALRDVPQTISIVPRALIEEQGATTLRDVLQNVPGLTIMAGEGGTPAGDNLTLRGFSARNDIFVDGVRDLGPQTRDPFNLEQVEVVKGPATVYSGRGATGGTINLVSKAPVASVARQATLAVGTDDTRRLTADINQPLGSSSPTAAFRLNAMAHDAGVAGRNAVTNQRWGVAPALSLGVGTPTTLTLGYFHLDQDDLSDYGIPWVPANNVPLAAYRNQPAPVPRETFYGYKDRDAEGMTSDLGTATLAREFSTALTLRNQLRYGRSTRDSIATSPRFASPDSTDVAREMRSWLAEDEIWDNQTDLTARFSSGPVRHALVAGMSLSHEGNVRRSRSAPNARTTLLDPNPNDVYEGEITESPVVGDLTGRSAAVYAFDTASLGDRVQVSGGLRYDYFDVDGTDTGGQPVARTDEMLSWRAGVVYKPRTNGSVYAAYGTALNPSLEALSYGGRSTDPSLEPEKTHTLELGSKWDLLRQRLSVAASVFRINKTNARTPGLLPDDPPLVLEGQQRVRGVELGVSGSLTRDWRVFSAYTLLDSEVMESNTPGEVGNSLPQTPGSSFSLWTSYRLPGDLSLGGGARFMGRRYNNVSNERSVGGYWTFDAMATYPVTRRLDLRLNLYNLTDAYYFERLGGGHLVPGAARSALLALTARF